MIKNKNIKKVIAITFVLIMVLTAFSVISANSNSTLNTPPGANPVPPQNPETVQTGFFVTATVSVGSNPDGVAYDSSNNYIYVANCGSNTVSVINGANNSVVATVSVGSSPEGVAYDSSNNYIYVVNLNSGTVSVINGANNSVVATVSGVSHPLAVAYDSSNNYIYVADNSASAVSVIFSLSVSASSSQNPTDLGNSVTFSSVVSGGTGSYTYQWYQNNTSISGATSSTYTTSFSYAGSPQIYVVVKDDGATLQSSTISETVNSDPSVSIVSSQNPTDTGNSIKLSSTVSNGTSPYTYQWYLDGSAISGATNITYSPPAYSSSGTYDYYLKVTDSTGYAVNSNTIDETVNSDPSVSASSNVTSGDVNYPIKFSSSPSSGTGPYTYNWTLNGVSISTSQDFSYEFGTSGNYTLTVTITDSVGISTSATVSVTIHPNPSVSIAASQNPADLGNSVTFSSVVSGGTGTDTYAWSIDGTGVSTAADFSYSFNATGIYYVNLTVTDSDGHTAFYSLKETVNPDPAVVIHETHNPTDVGVGVEFSTTITGGTGPYNYTWSIDGNTYYTKDANFTFASSGTFVISLTVTDKNGNQASYNIHEVVNPDPVATIQAEYSPVDVSANDTFSASIYGGTSPCNYTWSLGNKTLGDSSKITFDFTATGTYIINLTVVDSLGEKNSTSYKIKVIEKPSTLIEGPGRTDIKTNTTWEAYGSYGTGPYNYYWWINGKNITSGLYLTFSFNATGEYNITLILQDGQGVKAYAYLNVTANPLPEITIIESYSSVDEGIPVDFSTRISNGTPYYNYTWSIKSIGYVGYQSNLTYIFSSPGTYTVIASITDQPGNTATSSITIVVASLPVVSISVEYHNIDPNVPDNFNSTTSGGIAPYTYSWYINGTLTGNSSSLSHSFTSSGVYVVKLIISDSLKETSSYSLDVVVGSYPASSIIASSTQTDANISDTFRASGTGGIGPYSYEWLIAGHTFGNSTISYSFKTPGTYTVELIISDYFGKDALSEVNITVARDPHISVSYVGAPTVSQAFKFNSSVSEGIAPYKISWIFSDGQQETGFNVSHIFSSSGPRTFEVKLTDSAGYTQIRNFTVDVSLYVVIAVNTTKGLSPLAVQFSSSALGGSDYSYNWTFSPGHYSLIQNPQYTFGIGNYTVHFKVLSSNGATGSKNITIESLPPPVSFVYTTDKNITQPFDFRAIPNWDAKTPYHVSWSMPNGQTLTGMHISYHFPVYSEFNVVISSFTYDNHTYTKDLTIRMIPAIPVISFSVPSIVPAGTTILLNATATAPDSSSFTFSWSVSGLSYSGNGITDYLSSPGQYNITLTVVDGLGASATTTHHITVESVGKSSSITISSTLKTDGSHDYYTITVHSLQNISAVEAFLSGTELNMTEIKGNSTYQVWNLTLNQRDYKVGIFGITIDAFTTTGLSNSKTAQFSVSSKYSQPTFNLVAFLGGLPDTLLIIISIASMIIGYLAIKPKPESFNIDGNVLSASPGKPLTLSKKQPKIKKKVIKKYEQNRI